MALKLFPRHYYYIFFKCKYRFLLYMHSYPYKKIIKFIVTCIILLYSINKIIQYIDRWALSEHTFLFVNIKVCFSRFDINKLLANIFTDRTNPNFMSPSAAALGDRTSPHVVTLNVRTYALNPEALRFSNHVNTDIRILYSYKPDSRSD